MTLDLWTHQYCLACDKQVQDGAAYCSESCRLSDFENSTSTSSWSGLAAPSSSPGPTTQQQPQDLSSSSSSSSSSPSSLSSVGRFHLEPAYDFANARPYGTTPTPRRPTTTRLPLGPRRLTPSSSHSSLCSMQSTSTNTSCSSDAPRLSDEAKRELQAYAVSFEQVRTQRRQSL